MDCRAVMKERSYRGTRSEGIGKTFAEEEQVNGRCGQTDAESDDGRSIPDYELLATTLLNREGGGD